MTSMSKPPLTRMVSVTSPDLEIERNLDIGEGLIHKSGH